MDSNRAGSIHPTATERNFQSGILSWIASLGLLADRTQGTSGPADVVGEGYRSDEVFLGGPASSKKTSSAALPNRRAILMARGRLESDLPVSIAFMVCRETPSHSARSV